MDEGMEREKDIRSVTLVSERLHKYYHFSSWTTRNVQPELLSLCRFMSLIRTAASNHIIHQLAQIRLSLNCSKQHFLGKTKSKRTQMRLALQSGRSKVMPPGIHKKNKIKVPAIVYSSRRSAVLLVFCTQRVQQTLFCLLSHLTSTQLFLTASLVLEVNKSYDVTIKNTKPSGHVGNDSKGPRCFEIKPM